MQVGEGGAGDGGAGGVVAQVDLGDGQAVEPDVVAGLALPAGGGVAHLAHDLAVGAVEVGVGGAGGALLDLLEHPLAEGVVDVAGNRAAYDVGSNVLVIKI